MHKVSRMYIILLGPLPAAAYSNSQAHINPNFTARIALTERTTQALR